MRQQQLELEVEELKDTIDRQRMTIAMLQDEIASLQIDIQADDAVIDSLLQEYSQYDQLMKEEDA